MQPFVDCFIHPETALLGALKLKIAVSLDKIEIAVYHFPYLFNAKFVVTGISKNFRRPSGCRSGEKSQGTFELRHCKVSALDVVAVRLIDNNSVCHLHDASLYPLQFVTGAGKLDQKEKINH